MPQIYQGNSKIFDSGDGATAQSIYDGAGNIYLVYNVVEGATPSLTQVSPTGKLARLDLTSIGSLTQSTNHDVSNTVFNTPGYPGAQLVKINADGTIAWRKTAYELNYARVYDGSYWGFASIYEVICNTDGSVLLHYSITEGAVASLTDISNAGRIAKRDGEVVISSASGTFDVSNTVFGSISYPGAQLVKINADGTIAWRKTAYELNYARVYDGSYWGFANIARVTYNADNSILLEYRITEGSVASVTDISNAGRIAKRDGEVVISSASGTSDVSNTVFGSISYPGAQLVKINADGTIAWRKTAYELNFGRHTSDGTAYAFGFYEGAIKSGINTNTLSRQEIVVSTSTGKGSIRFNKN